MDSITIRSYESADLPEVVALAEQLGYPVSEDEAFRHMSAIEQDPDHVVLVAADSQGKVVGWVHVFLARRVFMPLRADLGGLVVDEAIRGKSIGEKLMGAVEEWASQMGCGRFIVRSNVVREEAHRFYERLGYKTFKQQAVLRKEL
jgi:GNAT superfamily N-acetyltransferase